MSGVEGPTRLTREMKQLQGIFLGMKNRCYCRDSKAHRWYGAKGIKICDQWLDNMYKFIEWGFKAGYRSGLTIDRINTNKDYTPFNCRWLTRSENSSKKPFIEKPAPAPGLSKDPLFGSEKTKYYTPEEVAWATGESLRTIREYYQELLDLYYAMYMCTNTPRYSTKAVAYITDSCAAIEKAR